jgi:hypothetical protein
MHTCIHAYMHTCMHTYIHLHTKYIYTYMHTYIRTNMMFQCVLIVAQKRKSLIYIHTYISAYVHTCVIHTRDRVGCFSRSTKTQTSVGFIHTNIRTYIHTHAHIHDRVRYVSHKIADSLRFIHTYVSDEVSKIAKLWEALLFRILNLFFHED